MFLSSLLGMLNTFFPEISLRDTPSSESREFWWGWLWLYMGEPIRAWHPLWPE